MKYTLAIIAFLGLSSYENQANALKINILQSERLNIAIDHKDEKKEEKKETETKSEAKDGDSGKEDKEKCAAVIEVEKKQAKEKEESDAQAKLTPNGKKFDPKGVENIVNEMFADDEKKNSIEAKEARLKELLKPQNKKEPSTPSRSVSDEQFNEKQAEDALKAGNKAIQYQKEAEQRVNEVWNEGEQKDHEKEIDEKPLNIPKHPDADKPKDV